MHELNDLLPQSSPPISSIETPEKQRELDLIKRCQVKINKRIVQRSVTRGLIDASKGRPTLELASKGATENAKQRHSCAN